MHKKWKEFHDEIHELERKRELASVRQTIALVKVCAENSTSWEEFKVRLEQVIARIEEDMSK